MDVPTSPMLGQKPRYILAMTFVMPYINLINELSRSDRRIKASKTVVFETNEIKFTHSFKNHSLFHHNRFKSQVRIHTHRQRILLHIPLSKR